MEKINRVTHTFECLVCGGPARTVAFYSYGEANHADHTSRSISDKLCSQKCTNKYYYTKKDIHLNTCSCGEAFHSKRSDAKYCSPKCRQKAYRKEQAFLVMMGKAAIQMDEDYAASLEE